ncbi:hypothetical protein ACQZ61_22125 [Agrobacterium vitis]|uniref:hypothetical protein n=1 Tax=Agrobacterium vitis TaxID=373 RepID=UPI0015DB9114|nr:hypothetical protein [Agrobacterium vitis]MCF1455022.1 hypothetical protein [Agrobacterium vitis]BCH57084.1 hypothetical protein RvVAR031_pl04150 [Agrobacterium vitis]
MSVVSEIPAISPEFAVEYFTRALALETDCFDVASAQKSNNVDFVLLHAVGRELSTSNYGVFQH